MAEHQNDSASRPQSSIKPSTSKKGESPIVKLRMRTAATSDSQVKIAELLLEDGIVIAPNRKGYISLDYDIEDAREKIGSLSLKIDGKKTLQIPGSQGKSLSEWMKKDPSKEYCFDVVSQKKNIVRKYKSWTPEEEIKLMDFMLKNKGLNPFTKSYRKILVKETGINATVKQVESKVYWWKKRFLKADKLLKSTDIVDKEARLNTSYPDYYKLKQIFSREKSNKQITTNTNRDNQKIENAVVTIKKEEDLVENGAKASSQVLPNSEDLENFLDKLNESQEKLRLNFKEFENEVKKLLKYRTQRDTKPI